jgi:glutamate 5-kinase
MKFQRIVIKLGTSTLTAGTANLSTPRIVDLVRQISQLHELGYDLALVTSGAIAAGRERLNFPVLPKDIPVKQMLSAIGQPRLMALYEQLFGLYNLKIGQVLLTRADLSDRRRYLNSRNTLEALLSQKIVPIINENDTVATEEIRVGDNDNLSALVANLIEADLLMLLTDQAGLYSADPRSNPGARLIKEVTTVEILDEIWQAAGSSASHLGTGGMITKLQAADLARRSGSMVVIAPGSEADVLLRVANGEAVGTRFTPVSTALESRKRYLLAGGNATDSLLVDNGAARALRKSGSLLPVGVVRANGKFERGDVVSVLDENNSEIARGLTNYSAVELARIRGCHSSEIESILGYTYNEEVIHRNNLVLL